MVGIVAVPGVLVAALLALITLHEWFVTGILEHTSGYHFGSEAMLYHGGWRYRSAPLYAWTCFAEGLVSATLAWGLATAARKRRAEGVAAVYAALTTFGVLLLFC